MKTINNKLITKPYRGKRTIRQKVSSGFASVVQKGNLVGLEVLVKSTLILNGVEHKVLPGDIAYFEEELLYNSKWSNQVMSAEKVLDELPGRGVDMHFLLLIIFL